MTFTVWITEYTGLSLYDFRVLDIDGTSGKEVRKLFHKWIKNYHPAQNVITKAIEAAANEGFNVYDSEGE